MNTLHKRYICPLIRPIGGAFIFLAKQVVQKGLIFLFLVTFWGLSADASVITVYEDNFDGSWFVNLHGLAPDVDNYGGGNTWIAHWGWKADGTPGPCSSATLPFTPTVGKIYRLTARFKNVAGNEDWLALGFAAGSSTGRGSNDDRFISGDTAGQPWMLRRGDNAEGYDQTFAGPGTANSEDISNTLDRSSDVDFQIILDTRPTQWRSIWYQKLTGESEYSIVRDFTYPTNPSIGAVGLACANEGTTGDIDYFLLEEIDSTLYIIPEGQPEDTFVFEGETAIFQVIFASDSSPSATWYQYDEIGDMPVNTADPNITVAIDYNSQGDEYTAVLQIQNASGQYEGIYYCVIDNNCVTVQSENATLSIKKLVAHWSLNETDYNGNYYVDTVGGYVAEPNGEPNFTTGIRNEPNGAVITTPLTGWGLSETFEANLTNSFTICLWVNWNGDWQEEFSIDDLEAESGETGYVVENAIKANQLWQHVCITYEDGAVCVYLNGRLRISETWELPVGYEATIEIGNIQGQQIFNGAIDDIRLYNYALNQTEISQLVTGEGNCILQYGLEYDLSGLYGIPDCEVNTYDLAEFSKHWLKDCILECGSEYDFSGPYGIPDGMINLYDLAEFCNQWLSCGMYPN